MKDIGIIFSTPMVQAILNTKPNVWPAEPIDPSKPFKSMTRRICKDIAGYDFKWGLDKEPYIGNYTMFTKIGPRKWGWVTLENQWLYALQTAVDENRTYLLKCPYGQPGDRLYVRETWKIEALDSGHSSMVIRYGAENMCHWVDFPEERFIKFEKFFGKPGWQSPYFMPKEASRLWLENKADRVERLWDMTEEDAKAEGVMPHPLPGRGFENGHRNTFERLWDSLNAKRGYGWNANPYVWVVEFRRVEK